ncbi:transposase, partial [Pseudarthrobacter sp. R1]|uniref:transposase n=1 Tax=Pseudarthrobacter sp. R1 TaxID=2944934 RepID=UPI00210D1F90
ADLKDSALAHLPSGAFAANSAWLVAAVMAYNLTRTAGILAAGPLGKARTGTIRRKLIHIPARIATSARRVRLHLPVSGPWQTPWQSLFNHIYPPPQTA